MINLLDSVGIVVDEDKLREGLERAGFRLIPKAKILECFAEETVDTLMLVDTKNVITNYVRRCLRQALGNKVAEKAVNFRPAQKCSDFAFRYQASVTVVLPD